MTALLVLIKGKCLKTEICAEELVGMSLGRAEWDTERTPRAKLGLTTLAVSWAGDATALSRWCMASCGCAHPANPLLHPHPVELQTKHFPQPDSEGSAGSLIHLTRSGRLPLQIHHPKTEGTWPLHIPIPTWPGVRTQSTTEPCCSLRKVSLPAFQGGGSSVT